MPPTTEFGFPYQLNGQAACWPESGKDVSEAVFTCVFHPAGTLREAL
jgi:hypothetical protein